MKTEETKNFHEFHNHVFGDYRYYAYNGLSEDVCTCLEGIERIKAEKLVLQSIKKILLDERAIRAAGYLRLQTAVPLLEKRLDGKNLFMRQNVHSSIVWALLKIKSKKEYLDKLINVVNNGSKLDGLTRPDAANLLSDFGKEPSAINALFGAFLDDDIFVRASALYALRKIFRNNVDVSNLLNDMSFASSSQERNSIVKQAERHVSV